MKSHCLPSILKQESNRSKPSTSSICVCDFYESSNDIW